MTREPDRLQFLDGLRALAALWVLLGHCRLFAIGWDAGDSWATRPLDILLYLHLPVDIFLVLSGFCLGLASRDGNIPGGSLRAYLWGRAARILPPYYAALLLILAVNWFVPLLAWGRHGEGLTPTIPARVIATQFLLLQDLFPTWNRVNGPFWSIAIEWHLYFLLPLLLLAVRRMGALATVAGAAVISYALVRIAAKYGYWSPDFPITVPYPPHYLLLFVLGIASSCWYREDRSGHGIRRRVAGAACVAATAALLWKLVQYPILDRDTMIEFDRHARSVDWLAATATAAALYLLATAPVRHRMRRLLEARPLVRLGHASYSLYLIHIPVLAAAYQGLQEWRIASGSPYLQFWILVAIGGTASVALAIPFAAVFERRATAMLRSAGPRTARAKAGPEWPPADRVAT